VTPTVASEPGHLVERIEAFYGQARRATVVNLLLGVLSCWALHGHVPTTPLRVWALALAVSVLLRWGLAVTRGRDAQADAHALRWGWVAAGALGASGAVWGLGAPLLLADAGPLALAFWTVAVCGIAAGVVAGTTWFVPAQWAYLLPLLLPLIGVHAQRGGTVGWAAAGGVALYLVFCLAQGWALARSLRESLAMRAENRALLAQVRDAAEARARFFAAASHDLRQPVQALVLLNAALATAQGAERERLLARLGDGITALDSLAESLLDVARLEAGAGAASPQALALQPLLQALATRQAPLAAANQQAPLATKQDRRFELRCSRRAAGVRADPAALERILANLLANAWRHGGTGTVLLAARPGRSGTVRLQVRDAGPGIAPAHQQAVFEPFFQLNNPQRDRAAGTGLGLATALGLAQAQGGTLTLRSAPGRGSCFELRLPAATPPPASTAPAALPAAPLPLQVLVVDDDPLVRDALATLLHQWGAQVTPLAAAAELPPNTARPDLLLCDRMLAGDDGFVQAAALGQRWQPPPRTVLMSGHRDPAARQAASARGWTWLDKPVRPLALRACLEAAATSAPTAAAEPRT
jgi:two-component system, sensor histidine kinase